MDSANLPLNTSKSTKGKLVSQLTLRYGADYKSALARDLKVNVSTIRRLFNQRDELPLIYVKAIEKILEERNE